MPDSAASNLPRTTVKIANIVFVLGTVISIIAFVYTAYKIYNPSDGVTLRFYFICIPFFGLSATFFSFSLRRLSENLKVNLSLLFVTTGIMVYGCEIYLEFRQQSSLSMEIQARQMGILYDTRTKLEMLEYLIDSGFDRVYPNYLPIFVLETNGLNTEVGTIFPLGSNSNSHTIFGNDSGHYPIIETDEHGFNNPKGLYRNDKIEVMLIGDSFAAGNSVHADESIAGVLRKSDFDAVTLGKGGNGPLLEFATLKEYAEPLEPKIVLWLYYEGNDLEDLEGREMDSLLLKQYLNEDDFSQNLISRQEEIDSVLTNWSEIHIQSQRAKEGRRRENRNVLIDKEKIIGMLKLTKVRILINLKPMYSPTPISTLTKFKEILQKSKQMVSGWGGKFYFVYLPLIDRYSEGYDEKNRSLVLRTARELAIPIIDIHKEVFAVHPDPLSLFPFRQRLHYNADGYRLVAEAITDRLRADGLP